MSQNNIFNSKRNTLRQFWSSLFLLNLFAILILWVIGSFQQLSHPGGGNLLIAFARISGLLLEYAILIQLILIGRMTFIEEAFGFDRMNRLHQLIGYSLATLIIAHPLLLTLGYSVLNHDTFLGQLVNFLGGWEDVFKAFIGLVLFLYVILISIPVVRRKINYELWHYTHLLAYVAVAFAFGHQINTGDVSEGLPLYYWLIFNFAIFGLLLVYRFLKPVYQTLRFGFRVLKVVKETADTNSVYISGRNLDQFRFRSGQYANISFLQSGLWQVHPFSFSSEYNGEYIRFTMKELGGFTKCVDQIKPGTRVIIEGPHGRFVRETATKDKMLFIAGGVGITPLRAMIGSEARLGKSSILLYGVRTLNDITFRSEFDEMANSGNLSAYYILGEKVDGYESGYIDQEKISRLAPDYLQRDVYVCGPPVMMNATIDTLKGMGVPKNQIHFEKFSH